MKRGIRKLVSAALAAGMVLTCAATSALAAEPDSAQEFRQGKTKMVVTDSVNMVLQEDGSLWGWGRSNTGMLGNNGGYDKEEIISGEVVRWRTYPEKVLTDVAFIEVGESLGGITIAIKKDNSLWCTGNITKIDTLGMQATNREYQSEFMKVMDDVVSAGSGNSLGDTVIYAVKSNGELWECRFKEIRDAGSNVLDVTKEPELGSLHFELKNTKIMDSVRKVSVTPSHALALKKDGSVWAWGYNNLGQLGNGEKGDTSVDAESKTPVKVLDDAKDIFSCIGFSAAIQTDGTLLAWGKLPDKEYGDETLQPRKITDNAKQISINEYGNAAILKEDNSVWVWGRWSSLYPNENVMQPRATSFTDISYVSVDANFLYIVKQDGSLLAVGDNTNKDIGIDAPDGRINTPVQLTGLTKTETPQSPTETPPVQSATATPTASKVLVNGKEISFDAYSINDNNYFKLRDIANVLSGTGKQFEVTWDGTKNAINLLSGKAYTTVGGELAKGDGSQKPAALNTSKVYLDGKEISLTAYTINDNNYFKLRDLGQTFNFGVGWDGAANTVTIDTSTGYTAE